MTLFSLLLWCGVLVGPFFALVFLIEGFLRPGYHPLSQPVSSLSHGPRGWVQQANFFITGTLLAAFGAGLLYLSTVDSVWAPLFVFIHGVALLGAGVFVTDRGIRDEDSDSPHTTSGILHNVFTTIVFISLALSCFVFAHVFYMEGAMGWGLYSLATGALYLIGFAVSGGGLMTRSTLAPIAGLLQRLTIVIGSTWATLLALHFLGI